jgi:hypothetical protein
VSILLGNGGVLSPNTLSLLFSSTVGSAPIEKSFRNVANRRDGITVVSLSRSKGKFRVMMRNLMTQQSFRTVVLALVSSLSVFGVFSQAQTANPKQTATPKQAPTAQATTVEKDVPAEFKGGIAEMISAKSGLEKAGEGWGGHRVNAMRLIDEALKELGQTQTASPTEMNSGPKDEPTAMNSGITKLQTAKSDFQKAGNEWGGRKAKAVSLVEEALKELQLGIDYAKIHNTY